jgi:hypothetical protein
MYSIENMPVGKRVRLYNAPGVYTLIRIKENKFILEDSANKFEMEAEPQFRVRKLHKLGDIVEDEVSIATCHGFCIAQQIDNVEHLLINDLLPREKDEERFIVETVEEAELWVNILQQENSKDYFYCRPHFTVKLKLKIND